VRADVYDHNLKKKNVKVSYNNFNKAFSRVYEEAKGDADIILLTGDLIDYGRGHWGFDEADRLQENSFYHPDRNWFLFSYLLARDGVYTKPVYTILGNHDWRLNPYPPFAPGSTKPRELFHDYRAYTKAQQEDILRKAHGDGHERKFSYVSRARSTWQFIKANPGQAVRALWNFLMQTSRLDKEGTPLETNDTSVAWYLFAINPFLDYSFTLPSGHSIMMLDWAEDEDVLFPLFDRGTRERYSVFAPEEATGPGPKAGNCLTDLQKRLVGDFLEGPSLAKIIGIHAPPIGPYGDWFDDDLLNGRKSYKDPKKSRGPINYATKRPDGKVEKWNGHPLMAFKHKDDGWGMDADCVSFVRARDWFIKEIAPARRNVRLVLAGHIHRAGIYTTYVEPATAGKALAGRWRVRLMPPLHVRNIPRQPAAQNPLGRYGPFYVNSTSAGPRGNDGSRAPTEAEASRGGLSLMPGYTHTEVLANGTVKEIVFRSVDTSKPGPGLPQMTSEVQVPVGSY
jgi:3',5'-cyclic AMP phosphodiesterase CpdA